MGFPELLSRLLLQLALLHKADERDDTGAGSHHDNGDLGVFLHHEVGILGE